VSDTTQMTPSAMWTPDCQGKQDYDGPLLAISCRFWPGPGGGGSMTFDTSTKQVGSLPYGRRPSAKASIILPFGQPSEPWVMDEYLTWREAEFEADTEEEVKAQVVAWVQERFDEVRRLLWPEAR